MRIIAHSFITTNNKEKIMKPLIVVVGATGQQGGSVIRALAIENRWTLRGLTRNQNSTESQKLIQQGFDLMTVDIDSFDECLNAFSGAYGVFAMTNFWSSGETREFEQGMNLVNAAHRQHVEHFIWSSLPDSQTISNGKLHLPHYMTKARVESFIRQPENGRLFHYTTFIHVGFYFQNFSTFFQPNDKFEFCFPLTNEARLPLFDVRDTGLIVAQCFQDPENWGQNSIVPLVSERLTMEQICQTIRQVTGNEKVSFVSLEYDQCSDKSEEYINNMRWYNEYNEKDRRLTEKKSKIHDRMKTFSEWLHETGRFS